MDSQLRYGAGAPPPGEGAAAIERFCADLESCPELLANERCMGRIGPSRTQPSRRRLQRRGTESRPLPQTDPERLRRHAHILTAMKPRASYAGGPPCALRPPEEAVDSPLSHRLDGHVAIVTGASRGIGLAIAQRLVYGSARARPPARHPSMRHPSRSTRSEACTPACAKSRPECAAHGPHHSVAPAICDQQRPEAAQHRLGHAQRRR